MQKQPRERELQYPVNDREITNIRYAYAYSLLHMINIIPNITLINIESEKRGFAINKRLTKVIVIFEEEDCRVKWKSDQARGQDDSNNKRVN